ncbi:Bidirectional sugar transporter SWEET16 [Hibiscus syriacus]|uniref:Bidirectional sugar transporter SWEET n=1 Tax=Hibiscus syriacus TaxID=106335 RepID=A0A6A3AVP0_HIBSY|nr:bidirectional sugar transporter SWEET17-like [Hibiscus syriacus]KAE8708794.1 Bidirectional sugar transporter SWEET16 [Hibiscus syriacus]
MSSTPTSLSKLPPLSSSFPNTESYIPKMEGLSFFVGVIGNVISVLVFLSPVGTFWRIVKHGSTEDFSSLPYVCTLLNSSLWTYYGITKPGAYLVATVNGFGILAEAIYVVLFLIYAPRKMRVKTGILVGILDVGILSAAVLVTRLALEGESRIDAIGFMCAALNIIMYGSPLAAMKTVVTSKSVEYMPFFLSFFLFLNGGVWAFYAFLEQDIFLGVPNGIGFLLGTAQLILYAIYNKARPSNNSISQGLLEQGFPK